jgi:O-antigen ligase
MRGNPWRWVCLAMLPLFGLALLHTDSQGGLVALVAAAGAAVVFGGPIRVPVAYAVAICGVLVLGYYALKPPSPGQFTEGRASRLDLWNVALHVANDHPVLGVGAGNFPVVEPAYTLNNIDLVRADLITSGYVAHNTYLNVLADYGSVGLLLLLAVATGSIFAGLGAARRFGRQGDREMELLARGNIVAVLGMLCAYFFQSGQFEKQLWLMLGCCAALDAVARRREPAPTPAQLRAPALAAPVRARSLAA